MGMQLKIPIGQWTSVEKIDCFKRYIS